jgi:uncharacterized repeat protein (TIGR01451 family)
MYALFPIPKACTLVAYTYGFYASDGDRSLFRSPTSMQAAANITVTKSDALQIDASGNGVVNPGDTIRYTVTIQNTGNQTSDALSFEDTIDPNTELVPGSLKSTPLARDDAYSTVGNVVLTVPAADDVLANDSEPDGSSLHVASYNPTSANGGWVSFTTNGALTYIPPLGFSGVDTFSYSVGDTDGNTRSATVSMTVGPVVWFIDNSAASGNGRLDSPFNSIAEFNANANDDPGDIIFIYQGAG